jgi:squalene-hopene/tetraprenyl-beta-curcumene cyclase
MQTLICLALEEDQTKMHDQIMRPVGEVVERLASWLGMLSGRSDWRNPCLAYLLLIALSPVAVMAEEPKARITLASEEQSAYQETVALAPITPEEPLREQYSAEAAVDYLDALALNWQREQKCLACHANFAYLIARPAVSWDVPVHRQIRLAAERAVEGENLPAEEPERSSQAVLLAAALAVNDAKTTRTSHPLTRRALDRMWTLERGDGTWPWPTGCKWPPSEIDEFYGVAVAALAAGVAPGEYRQTPQAKQGLEKIRGFFSRNPPATTYQRGLLLWISRYLDGIMGEAQKKAAVDELLALQRPGGGWAFAALGSWQRSDGKPQDTRTSDGYGTGFAVYVLRMAGLPAQHPQIQKGVGWLKTHQRSSGRWYTRSANKDSKHLIANEGTAFALMALAACDEIGLRRENLGRSPLP